MALRIIQINLNRCRLAQDIMEHNISQLNVDIVIISEPYRQQRFWFNDVTGDTSIWVTGFNGHFPTLSRPMSAEGIVAVIWESKLVISCYCSPKNKLAQFGAYLDVLEGIMVEARAPGMGVILAGDLNARSPAWGGTRQDKKGLAVLEILGRHSLVPVGLAENFPYTFSRNNRKSFIDILSADLVSARGIKSEVLGKDTFSDHRYVLHVLKRRSARPMAPAWQQFSVKNMDPETILRGFAWRKGLTESRGEEEEDVGAYRAWVEPLADRFQRILEEVTRAELPSKSLPRGSRKPNGWWSEEIAEARRESFRVRRAYQKRRKKKAPDVEEARLVYVRARKAVQIFIWRAKEAVWRELYSLVDLDPWGKPYKVVMSRLKGCPHKMVMTPAQVRETIAHLFVLSPYPPSSLLSPLLPLPPIPDPVDLGGFPDIGRNRREAVSVSATVESVDAEIIKEAVSRIKTKKAPGLDGVPSEVVACVAGAFQADVLEVVRDTLSVIPSSWKRARVVLIPKPGKDPSTPGAFRPISILPVLSKVWEYALKAAIEKQTGKDPFHLSQFGFRRGSGTVEAALEVTRFAEGCVAKTKKRLCVMVTLDVKNAFNTLGWERILEELETRGVSGTLVRVMWDYFADRWVTVLTPKARVDCEIRAGVPQGSVLGPFLWNIVYDGIVRELNKGRFIKAVAYADDLALLFSARDVPQMEGMIASTMEKVRRWFGEAGLEIAPQKTEVVILAGLRSNKIRDFSILGTTCTSAKSLRYLGVTMDCRRSFKLHLENATQRGDKLVGALATLLPNTRGPSLHARRLYYNVWESVVMYAAPVWASALNTKVNRAILRRSQRSALVRTTTAYRSVAHQVVCVLAGRMPLDIKATIWRKVFLGMASDREDPAIRNCPGEAGCRIAACKRRALEEALEE